MVEQQTHKGDVVSSYPAGRISREFCSKNTATSMAGGAGRTGAGRWRPSPKKKFAIIFGFFRIFILSSAFPALGKGFAECPTKSTRQKLLCQLIFCRVRYSTKPLPSVFRGTRQSAGFQVVVACSSLYQKVVRCFSSHPGSTSLSTA